MKAGAMAESNGTTAVAERVQAEATGSEAEGANVQEDAKGTPADAASVHPENTEATTETEGEAAPNEAELASDLKWSDATLEAEKETHGREVETRVRGEIAQAQATRRAELLKLADERGATTPALLRTVEGVLKGLELSPEESEAVIKPAREALGLVTDLAIALADQDYRDTINRLLEADKDDPKAFWAEADGRSVAGVLDLLVEHRARNSKWVKDADADDLIKASSKLRTHISKIEDAAKVAGRDQARRDRNGDRSNETAKTQAAPSMTTQQLWQLDGDAYESFKREHPDTFKKLVFGG
jgi:hypothetical protein